jgi:hypothetical protein
VAVEVAAAQQEFCSTTLYCLPLVAVAVEVVEVDSVPGNQLLVQVARPTPGYMQVKMDRITPGTVAVVVEVVEAGPGATGAQLEVVIPAL